MEKPRRWTAGRLLVLQALLLAAFAPRALAASCAKANHPGGDWPFLNRDLHNTRHQPLENLIGPEEAPFLAPVAKFSVASEGSGSLQSTPIVANGCVYVGSSTGWVFALDADSLELVWKRRLNGTQVGLGFANGLVYAFPYGAASATSEEPPGAHAVALDADNGALVWTSPQLDAGAARTDGGSDGTWINASPVVFPAQFGQEERPLLFVPLSVGFGPGSRVPLYFLDALTGQTVRKFFALPDKDYELGFAGAGIWSTAAFDERTRHLYAGTADSEGFSRQHRFNDAILKIDADPSRPTFATVVDAYKGVDEHYVDALSSVFAQSPACASAPADPNQRLFSLDPSAATECGELDLDFGASPNLFVDANGDTLVGEMQKAGVFHAVYAATLQPAWVRIVSGPLAAGNAATSAVDGTSVYVSANPASVFAFDKTFGLPAWVSTTANDAIRYQPLTVANGVVYTLTNGGALVAIEASTGRLLLERPVSLDAELASCGGLGAGVAVARNTVYAQCDGGGPAFGLAGSADGWVIAYRPMLPAETASAPQ
jgi:outer membrane protein assembly factor BamB